MVESGRILRLMRWLLLVPLVVVLTATSVHAEEPTVGILRIDTEGVSDAAAVQFESEVEEALQGVGATTVGSKKLHQRLEGGEYMVGCTFGPCLRAVAAVRVPLVLVARIRGDGSSYHFVITLVDTKSGIHTSQVSQTCAVCTVEEAISTATLATVALITGTADATVTDPSAGPTAEISLGDKKKSAPALLRTSGLVFLGLGAAAVVVGGYLYLDDTDSRGGPIGLATGGALLSGGATMVLLSRRF